MSQACHTLRANISLHQEVTRSGRIKICIDEMNPTCNASHCNCTSQNTRQEERESLDEELNANNWFRHGVMEGKGEDFHPGISALIQVGTTSLEPAVNGLLVIQTELSSKTLWNLLSSPLFYTRERLQSAKSSLSLMVVRFEQSFAHKLITHQMCSGRRWEKWVAKTRLYFQENWKWIVSTLKWVTED